MLIHSVGKVCYNTDYSVRKVIGTAIIRSEKCNRIHSQTMLIPDHTRIGKLMVIPFCEIMVRLKIVSLFEESVVCPFCPPINYINNNENGPIAEFKGSLPFDRIYSGR